jgi:hypothetical protein
MDGWMIPGLILTLTNACGCMIPRFSFIPSSKWKTQIDSKFIG